MNCTATTRLTAAQCMERLAECPALPRGDRLPWWRSRRGGWGRLTARTEDGRLLSDTFAEALAGGMDYWARKAAPVRRLREERRALREALAEVLGPASPPPVSSDVVKNMLNQIEAFSTAMRRTWGEP